MSKMEEIFCILFAIGSSILCFHIWNPNRLFNFYDNLRAEKIDYKKLFCWHKYKPYKNEKIGYKVRIDFYSNPISHIAYGRCIKCGFISTIGSF